MRKLPPAFESVFLFSAAGLLLALALLVLPLRPHVHLSNSRILYGLAHLPAALLASAIFTAAAALIYRIFRQGRFDLDCKPTAVWLTGLALLFCSFWLPVLLSSGFVQDDWMLLAAAATRTIIPAHPLDSWMALDSVDGNFRPLGTVLYFAYALRAFGLHPTVFLTANFLLNLASTLTAFFIVRRMGYTHFAAAAGAILFMSRGILYTQSCWTSALGDCIVLLLTALTILALLTAIQRTGAPAALLHLAAFVLFALSTVAKQSSFATPLIVALLLFLRPGPAELLAVPRRLIHALTGLAVYGAFAAFIFLHARHLLGGREPYPMHVNALTTIRSFAYFFWYFFTFYFPNRIPLAHYLPGLIGLTLLAALVLLLRRLPALTGERPRDLLFLAAAAAASVSLFLGLTTRNEAYYGTEAAFWLSLAFGIMLTRFGSPLRLPKARIACFILCLLAVTGFFDVRLKQIGLLWAGGYVWGDSGTAADRLHFQQLQAALATAPHPQTVVLVDPPEIYSWFTSMVILLDPSVQRLFIYRSDTGNYLANDHDGLRPVDGVPALVDSEAYNWLTPIAPQHALALVLSGKTLWLRFAGATITGSAIPPRPLVAATLPSFRPSNP